MFDSKLTPEDSARIVSELEKPIDPFDDDAVRQLACAVIFDTLKPWKNDLPGTTERIRKWLFSPDYRFWARMAGIDCEVDMIIRALTKNNGVYKAAMMKELSN